MADTPDVGFSFGVEGDQALLATINQLRAELKNLAASQDQVQSSAIDLAGAWRGLVAVAATLKLAQFASDAAASVIAIGRLSAATGISTQTLSVFRKATQDAGLSQEQADTAILRLSKSIFALGQGNKAVAATFALLRDSAGRALTADSFKGLTDDQKFLRVADALGRLKGGLEAAGAAQQIFGRGSGELLAVFQRMTSEEYPELAAQTRALGEEITPQMVESFLRAKQSLEDLKGEAEGVTREFEAGMVPELTKAADGIVQMFEQVDQGKSSWESMGETAGVWIKYIIAGFADLLIWVKALSLDIFELIGGALQEVYVLAKTDAESIFYTLTLHFSKAWQAVKNGGRDAAATVGDAWDDSRKRIDDALESEKKLLEGVNNQRPHAPSPRPSGESEGAGGLHAGAPAEDLSKARLAAERQRSEDELALDRILAQGREQADKDSYERGLISLTEYFNRRRDAIRAAAAEEEAVLQKERAGLEQQLATEQARKTTTPRDQTSKQREILEITQQIAHVDAQIKEDEAKASNEEAANETARFTATEQHQRTEIELRREIAEMQGDKQKADEADEQLMELDLTVKLRQAGQTVAQIDAALAEFRTAQSARTTAAGAQGTFESGVKGLDAQKQQLAEQVAAGEMMPYQANEKLRAIYLAEIPLLQQQVDLLRQQAAAIEAAAKARGETGPNAEADRMSAQAEADAAKIAELTTAAERMNLGWMEWKTTATQAIDQVSNELTTGLNGWISQHESFRKAIEKTWNSMVMTAVESLEKIASQWIAQHLRMLLIKQVTDQAGVASTATATAEGDAIKRASSMKDVLQSAKQAAVHAFQSVWAALPFPFNVVLAPVAAAAAFAGAMALGAFASGGAVNAASATPRFTGFEAGGAIIARSMLGGALRQAGGGTIRGPGGGTSDSVPILASDGEHVMTARAARAIGPGTLDAINANPDGWQVARNAAFADGGAIARGASLPAVAHPAPYSAEGFHRYASGGTIDASSTGGDTHFHLPTHIGEIKAWDGPSVREAIEEHGDLVGSIAVAAVKRHMRTSGVGG